MILVGLTFMSAGSSLCTAFASTLWQFYLAQFGSCINICLYSIARSLFTRAVNPNEVGKIFGFVALMVATVPLLGNLVYRYDLIRAMLSS